MTNNKILPSIESLKTQAKRLRAELDGTGSGVSHAKSLEMLAHQLGFHDWNTLHAAVGNRAESALFSVGERTSGHYLGQPFTAEIIGLQKMSDGNRFRITLKLDEPVDVVTFDSFSAFRHRITGVVGKDGKSEQKTSNGVPQLVLQTA